DGLVEELDTVLADTERLAGLHETGPGARVQLAVAPCSPFSVTGRLMTESAELARRLDLPLHTHLAETIEEEAYCRELYGCRRGAARPRRPRRHRARPLRRPGHLAHGHARAGRSSGPGRGARPFGPPPRRQAARRRRGRRPRRPACPRLRTGDRAGAPPPGGEV